MPEPKAQLVDPQGPIDVPGLQVTGVTTATGGFVGNVQGSATGLASTTTNLNVGIVTATKFSGNTTGTVSGLADDTNINVGIITSTSFTGDLVGNAAGLSTTTANIKAGIMSATSFAGNFTGVASGITGTPNIVVGIMTGTLKGDGSGLTGIAATNFITNNVTTTSATTYAITVGHSGSSAYTLSGNDRNGSVSGSNAGVAVNVGDTLNFAVSASGHPFYIRVSNGGANVSTPAATNQGTQSGTVSWTPNTAGTYYYQCGNHSGMIGTITVSDSTTSINLSDGNVIYFTQNVDTTVSFANTGTSNIVTFIRTKDDTSTARTITWPSAIKWNGGSAPTLNTAATPNDVNVITLLTRDEGVTWYGWDSMSSAGGYYMFMWGDNEQGRYGNSTAGPATNKSSPTQVNGGADWTKLYGSSSTGADYTTTGLAMVAKEPGTLWTWGANGRGVLGHNDTNKRSSPVQVPGTTWAQVSSNGYNSNEKAAAAIKTDGTLWTWGNNENGRLGQNTVGDHRSSPVQVGSDTTWRTTDNSVGCGSKSTVAIKTDGTLWAIGSPYATNIPFPGGNRSSPVQIPGTTWNKISAGMGNSFLATKTDGTLWAWGYNIIGTLGINSSSYNVLSPTQIPGTSWDYIHAGYAHGAATKTDGTLWVWGDNRYGNLAQNYINNPGGGTSYSSPVQIPGTTWSRTSHYSYQTTHALKTDGTLWAWGRDIRGSLGLNQQGEYYSSPVQVPGTNWIDIASAYYGVTALRSSL